MCLLIGIISHVSDVAHGPLVSIINLNYTVFQSQHDTLSILFLIMDIKRGEHVACTHFASVSIFRASTYPGYQALS